jgi:hypothetical protein
VVTGRPLVHRVRALAHIVVCISAALFGAPMTCKLVRHLPSPYIRPHAWGRVGWQGPTSVDPVLRAGPRRCRPGPYV